MRGSSREIRAIQVAIASSIIGALTKTVVGVITGSMTMISSAVDSAGDLMVSIANLFVVRLSDREPDEDHNYGHAKIEGLGAMFEGGFIVAAGTFIIYEALHKAMIGEVSHDSLLGIAVMVPLLVLTTWTVLYLRRVAEETGSLVIKADALHYATDVYVNVGVLVALSLVWLTRRAPDRHRDLDRHRALHAVVERPHRPRGLRRGHGPQPRARHSSTRSGRYWPAASRSSPSTISGPAAARSPTSTSTWSSGRR